MNKVLNQRYELLTKIGEGGMAITYAARDRLLDREVAVKVMREEFLSDEEFVQRFRREAQAVAKLNHPNIAGVYDIGRDNSALYMVMELVKGCNLKQLIKQQGAMSEQQAARIGRQVAEALAKAHREGIIHRDIKPHNILIADGESVKVTDFGIARALSSTSLTKTQSIIGTVQYLSPEQARGETAVPASDLYSLGIVLYEAVTGHLPFSGENPVAIALKHAEEEPPPPSKYNPEISAEMETVIYRALQKSAKDRYTSARDLGRDLEAIEKGRPLDDTSERTAVINRPRTTKAAEPAAEPLSRTMVRPPSVREVTPADLREYTPPRPLQPRSSSAGFWALAVLLAVVSAAIGLFMSHPHVTMISVPDLKNMTVDEARAKLKESKLELGKQKRLPNDQVPEDQVFDQSPAAGLSVEENSPVDLIISRGRMLTDVPDITGMTLAKARQRLLGKGLNLGGTTDEFSDDVPQGVVIRQIPDAGKRIEKNAKVALILSKGKQPPTPPVGSGDDNKARGNVEYTIPDSGPDEMVFKVVTVDDTGEHTVYEEKHKRGDKVNVPVEGVGKTTVRCFLQGTEVKKLMLEPGAAPKPAPKPE